MDKNTEIDLIEVFINIALFFKRYLKLFIGSILLGLILAFIFYARSPKIYKSDITVLAANKQVYINKLESLNEEFNSYNVSKKLNISEDIAKSIVKIEPERLFSEDVDKEGNKQEYSNFKIYVSVLDTSVFSDVKKGLKFFAENDEYYQQVFKISNSQREELINYINQEINKLDSLRLENKNNQSVYIENKSNTNSEILSLFIKKQDLQKTNQLVKIFRVIKGFEKGLKPKKSKKMPILIVFAVSILGFFIALFIELSAKLKKLENKD